MIARALIPILIITVMADACITWRFMHRSRWWKKLLWWMPALIIIGWAIRLAMQSGFVGDSQAEVEYFLLAFALIVVPKAVFAFCSLVGRLFVIGKRRRKRNYGNLVGLVGVLFTWYVVLYGTFVGFYQLEVRHVEVTSADLPTAFDGYRIVQFSDIHVGTLNGKRQRILKRMVDSINAQKADMVVFTGDLQNTEPQDIYPHLDLLSTVKAPDGVYSILGNHDYAYYVDCDDAIKVANCRETASLERQMGWTLLNNNNRRIHRDHAPTSSAHQRHHGGDLIIAGMENDGENRFPHLGNLRQALAGVRDHEFVVMLEHDPTAWRQIIQPASHTQLTLSGHTHAAQFKLFGWSPASLRYREWDGLYQEGDQYLYVSAGVSGLIPFRFGVPGEIVVITLRAAP